MAKCNIFFHFNSRASHSRVLSLAELPMTISEFEEPRLRNANFLFQILQGNTVDCIFQRPLQLRLQLLCHIIM